MIYKVQMFKSHWVFYWNLINRNLGRIDIFTQLNLHLLIQIFFYILFIYFFIMSRMLYKWSHTVYNLFLRQAFFSTSYNFLEIIYVYCINFFSVLSSSPFYDVPQLFSTHLWKYIWVVSSFWLCFYYFFICIIFLSF